MMKYVIMFGLVIVVIAVATVGGADLAKLFPSEPIQAGH